MLENTSKKISNFVLLTINFYFLSICELLYLRAIIFHISRKCWQIWCYLLRWHVVNYIVLQDEQEREVRGCVFIEFNYFTSLGSNVSREKCALLKSMFWHTYELLKNIRHVFSLFLRTVISNLVCILKTHSVNDLKLCILYVTFSKYFDNMLFTYCSYTDSIFNKRLANFETWWFLVSTWKSYMYYSKDLKKDYSCRSRYSDAVPKYNASEKKHLLYIIMFCNCIQKLCIFGKKFHERSIEIHRVERTTLY